MKKIIALLILSLSVGRLIAQTEDYYGPVKISFHGFICNRPTNDDPFGMDGVSDEVSVDFWTWSPITVNRAAYTGIHTVYGENFLLPERVKAGTATINGGIKAGDSYYREGVYDDNNLNSLSKYDIVNTFCSNSTLIAIFPALFEIDEGPLTTSPFQDMYIATRHAFQDGDIQQGIQDFSESYIYNDSNPYGFFLAGRYIGLDAKYAGMFTANKNKLASRPIGLFANWDYSSQLIVLTPKTIKIIAEKDYGYGKGILPVHFNEESMGNTEGHGNYIVLLRVLADIKDRNAGATSNLRTIGVKVDSALAGEEYKFRLHSGARFDSVKIKSPNTTAYFPTKIAEGQSYDIEQTGGPRYCQIAGHYGSVGASDFVVTANCVLPPSSQKIGVRVNVVGDEERFEFSAGGTRKIIITEGNKVVYFGGSFASGTNYTITQISGPRTCLLTPVSGQVGREDIIIDANCGTLPALLPLGVRLTAPKGTTIILQLNNGDTAKYTVPFENPNGLGTGFFKFPKSYPEGSDYSVTIKSSPSTLGCFIYENGEGKIDGHSIVGVRCDKKGYDLVSRSTDDKILNTYYESFTPVIGGKEHDEGRYVAFVAYGNGIDGSDGKYRQVFWRDRKMGITKLISKNAAGEQGNGNSLAPAISADGRSVTFESYATNFGEADNNANRDIYVWSEGSGNVTLVSRSQQGGTANGESYEPTISGDGSVIAYTSNASDIVTLEPVFSTPNVYVCTQGSNEFITKDYETGKAVGGYAPSISEDGSKIVFCAYTNRLVQNVNNNLWDIFLWQSGMMGLKRISLTASGGERNQGTESASRVVWPAISGDGNFVAYATTASNMVDDDTNAMQDIFICNTSTGGVERVSKAGTTESNGDSPVSQGERIGISYDGAWITYNTNADNIGVAKGNIVLQNTRSGYIIPVTDIKNGSTARPMISRGGAYVIAGCSEKYDPRFPSSGIFVFYPH